MQLIYIDLYYLSSQVTGHVNKAEQLFCSELLIILLLRVVILRILKLQRLRSHHPVTFTA